MTTQNLPATTDQANVLVKIIESQSDQLAIALGKMVPVEYFIRVAKTAIRKSPLLQVCTPDSIMGALMDMAQLKIIPDSVTGEAYMVPFFDHDKKAYIATLMIGYKGFVKLMRRNSVVRNLHADVVYSGEKFEIEYGTNRKLVHQPCLDASKRGVPIGAYGFISTDTGDDFVFVDADYIRRVKASSKGSDSEASPWNVWPESMWKKSAIRQLAKTADISPDVAEALNKEFDTSNAIDVQAFASPAAAVVPSGLIAAASQPPGPSQAPPDRAKAAPAAPKAAQSTPRARQSVRPTIVQPPAQPQSTAVQGKPASPAASPTQPGPAPEQPPFEPEGEPSAESDGIYARPAGDSEGQPEEQAQAQEEPIPAPKTPPMSTGRPTIIKPRSSDLFS